MANRTQVDDLRQPGLRPTASPVDTYVQPNAGAGLEQLATGLASISPSLGKWTGNLAQRDADKQLEAGREKARAMGLEAKALAKAVKDGKIPEAANPWFRAGLQEQLGRVAADQFGAKLSVALSTDEALKDSTNLGDFDTFVEKNRAAFLQETVGDSADRHFTNGFGTMSDSWIHNARSEFAAGVASRLVKQNDDALAARTYAGVEQALGSGVSHEQIGADLTKMLDDQYALNPNGGGRSQQAVVEGLVRLAKATDDSTVLDIIKHIKSGVKDKKGERLGLDTTKYGAEAIEDITEQIGLKKVQDWDIAAKTKKHNAEPIIGDFVNALVASNDPMAVDIEPYLKKAAAVDPQAVETLRQLRSEWVNAIYDGDPNVEADMFTRVFTKPGSVSMRQLSDAYVGTKKISRQAFLTMVNEIQQQQASEREGRSRGLLGDPDLTKLQTRVRGLFVSEYGDSTAEQRARAESAVNKATMRYLQEKKDGKLGTSSEMEDFVHRQSYDLLLSESSDINADFLAMVPTLADFQKQQKEAAKVPNGSLPDWKKEKVLSGSQALSMESEFNDWVDGRRTALSDATKQLLFANRVAPTRQAMKEFIDAQKRLANK